MFLFSCNTENIILINGRKGATFFESNEATSSFTGHIHSHFGQSCCVLLRTTAGVLVLRRRVQGKVPQSFLAVRQLQWYVQDKFGKIIQLLSWQFAGIIFSVAHKWEMIPDPLKFFLCYFPNCSKSSIISSPDVSKRSWRFAKFPNSQWLWCIFRISAFLCPEK